MQLEYLFHFQVFLVNCIACNMYSFYCICVNLWAQQSESQSDFNSFHLKLEMKKNVCKRSDSFILFFFQLLRWEPAKRWNESRTVKVHEMNKRRRMNMKRNKTKSKKSIFLNFNFIHIHNNSSSWTHKRGATAPIPFGIVQRSMAISQQR